MRRTWCTWRSALGALGLVSCALGYPRGPLDERRWVVVETEHFEILSDADESRSEEFALEFERFRSFVQDQLGMEHSKPRIPGQIYLFTDFSTYRLYGQPPTAGFFLETSRAHYIATGARGGQSDARVVFHEYGHYLLRTGGLFGYPPWFDEGHAELLGSTRIEEDGVEFGRSLLDRIRTIRRFDLLPLRVVLFAENPWKFLGPDRARFYATSWAFVHYLYFFEVHRGSSRWKQKDRFLQLVNQGTEAEAAFEQAFGTSVGAMERELKRYVERPLPYVRYPRPTERPARALRVRVASPVEVALRLAELDLRVSDSSEVGVRINEIDLQPERRGAATERLRRAVARAPRSARAHALLGEALAAADRPEEARAALERAIELEPGAAEHRVAFGDLLAGQAIARDSSLQLQRSQLPEAARRGFLARAREEYERAIELAPELPRAHLSLAASYLGPDGDPQQAVLHADRAFALLPSNPEVALVLTEALLGAGRVREAQKIAKPLLQGDGRGELIQYLESRLAGAETSTGRAASRDP